MRRSVMLALLALSMAALGSLGSAQGVSHGSAGGSTPYHNLFGWHVGDVDVQWDYTCIGCYCGFTGAPTVSETLPIQDCSIVGVSISFYSCGPTADCPGGVIGQMVVLTIECCVELEPFGVSCVSHQETLYACPPTS